MIIADLKKDHPEIYEMALAEQEKQGNKRNDQLHIDWSADDGNFNWRDSDKQQYFWMWVNDGNFYKVYKTLDQKYEGPENNKEPEVKQSKAPAYYDNSKGSLYKIAEQRKWNSYTFDVVKRLDRGGKKDPLRQEIEKSIVVLQLWLKESEDAG